MSPKSAFPINLSFIGLFNSCKNEDLEKRIIYIHEMDNIDLKNQVKKVTIAYIYNTLNVYSIAIKYFQIFVFYTPLHLLYRVRNVFFFIILIRY